MKNNKNKEKHECLTLNMSIKAFAKKHPGKFTCSDFMKYLSAESGCPAETISIQFWPMLAKGDLVLTKTRKVTFGKKK